MPSFKKIIKSNLFSLAGYTKAYKLFQPFYSGIGHILVFHRVCNDNGSRRILKCSGLEVSAGYLEKVIRFFMKHNYDSISPDQLFDNLKRGKIKRRFVIFTFDDGYQDTLTCAYPVFKKYNIPLTVYIAPGFADRSAVLWWYLLEELLLKEDFVSFRANGRYFEFPCASTEEKENAFLKIGSIIRNSDENNYRENIRQIFVNHMEIYGKIEQLMLNWQQIRQLSVDPLVTLGTHSLNHYCLSNLSEEAVRFEMLESKNKLESCINRQVKHFSYPYGDRGEAGIREFKIAKECGFQTAVTTRSANIFPAHRLFCQALPRITMGESIDDQRLDFLINGFMHFKNNKFRRVVSE